MLEEKYTMRQAKKKKRPSYCIVKSNNWLKMHGYPLERNGSIICPEDENSRVRVY